MKNKLSYLEGKKIKIRHTEMDVFLDAYVAGINENTGITIKVMDLDELPWEYQNHNPGEDLESIFCTVARNKGLYTKSIFDNALKGIIKGSIDGKLGTLGEAGQKIICPF